MMAETAIKSKCPWLQLQDASHHRRHTGTLQHYSPPIWQYFPGTTL